MASCRIALNCGAFLHDERATQNKHLGIVFLPYGGEIRLSAHFCTPPLIKKNQPLVEFWRLASTFALAPSATVGMLF
jgi:hypothetical protein